MNIDIQQKEWKLTSRIPKILGIKYPIVQATLPPKPSVPIFSKPHGHFLKRLLNFSGTFQWKITFQMYVLMLQKV